jgi:hypothetical protein
MSASTHTTRRVDASDPHQPLGLMRAYCDFYKAPRPTRISSPWPEL